MKYEWRKEEKTLYLPKAVPQIVEVPKQKFLVIEGKGNPNDEDFAERIGVLYAVSYGIRMMSKNGFIPEGYFEYTVYPLEGVWDMTEEGKKSGVFCKEELIYKLMIRQPDFVNRHIVMKALEMTKKKKPHPLLEKITFEEIEDGLCVQVLHEGSFDDEPVSFEKMVQFMTQHQLERRESSQREIYLNDARKVEKSKLKTVLRYFVVRNSSSTNGCT